MPWDGSELLPNDVIGAETIHLYPNPRRLWQLLLSCIFWRMDIALSQHFKKSPQKTAKITHFWKILSGSQFFETPPFHLSLAFGTWNPDILQMNPSDPNLTPEGCLTRL